MDCRKGRKGDIATDKEIMRILTVILRDDDAPFGEKIKAIELLMKLFPSAMVTGSLSVCISEDLRPSDES